MTTERPAALVTWTSLPRPERRFAVLLGIALVLITGAPYLYGWIRTPPGHTFTGIHGLTGGDMTVYLSLIEQTRDGHLLTVNQFTAEPGRPQRLTPFWTLVGLFARVTNASGPAAFHTVRLLLIIPFTCFLSVLVAAFLREPIGTWSVRTVRRTALLLIAFSSGFGAYLARYFEPYTYSTYGYEHWPPDLWVAESNTFLILLQSPHFLASIWLILATILTTLRFLETGAWRWSLATAVLAGTLVTFHPYYAITIVGILIAETTLVTLTTHRMPWRNMGHLGVVTVGLAPGTAYYLSLLARDPFTAAHAARNILITPSWWLVLTGFGALVPFAVLGAGRLLERLTPAHRLLIAWVVTTAALSYAPVPWQRKLLEGIHPGLAITAAIGMFVALAWCARRLPPSLTAVAWSRGTACCIAVPLFGFTTLFTLARDVALYSIRFPTQSARHSFYYPTDGRRAMAWIRNRTHGSDAATLGLALDGHLFPGYTGRTTVFGHAHETVNFAHKEAAALALARGSTTPDAALDFLHRERVRFILISDASAPLWRRDPSAIPNVRLAFRDGNARVYEVDP